MARACVQVREGLAPLIASIKPRSEAIDDKWLQGDYDVEQQAALCKQVRRVEPARCAALPKQCRAKCVLAPREMPSSPCIAPSSGGRAPACML